MLAVDATEISALPSDADKPSQVAYAVHTANKWMLLISEYTLSELIWEVKVWQVISHDLEASNQTPNVIIDIFEDL